LRALVFTAPGAVELLDVPEPELAPDEHLVHVRSAGICGSELHGVRDPGFRVPPLIMGHEFAGVTGDGTEVLVNPLLSCGKCDLCGRGTRQLCRERVIIGIGRPGGFGERVAVPASALQPKPAGLSWDTAAMAEPAASAVHAVNLARGVAGQRVAVLGCGAIGLLAVLAASAAGAASVEVTDLSQARLEVARRLGARPAVAGRGLDGEYDLIIDAAGTAQTRAQSVRHQRPGGLAVWVGLATADAGFDAQALVRTEKRVTGSFAYTDDDFSQAAGLLAGWDLSWVNGYPLEAGARVFTSLMDGALEPVKAMLNPAQETLAP
jgi:threonine dehydrogenase-like Zn-dependent dehydrogenase